MVPRILDTKIFQGTLSQPECISNWWWPSLLFWLWRLTCIYRALEWTWVPSGWANRRDESMLISLGYGLSQHWNYQTVSVTKGALPSLLEVLSFLTAETTVLKPAALASLVNLLELQNHWSYLRPTESVNSNKIPKSSVCTMFGKHCSSWILRGVHTHACENIQKQLSVCHPQKGSKTYPWIKALWLTSLSSSRHNPAPLVWPSYKCLLWVIFWFGVSTWFSVLTGKYHLIFGLMGPQDCSLFYSQKLFQLLSLVNSPSLWFSIQGACHL